MIATALCACSVCADLDRAHPREGRQLRLVPDSSGSAPECAPIPDFDAPTAVLAGVSVPSGRSVETSGSLPDGARGHKPEKPVMNAVAIAAPKPARKAPKSATPPAAKSEKAAKATAPIARIVPSAPSLFELKQLRRAPENVRHTRVDEDIVGLADDIAAHGLLQSLIGYKDPDGKIQIVGGGRRFQALRRLEEDGLINGEWSVPVLIRDVDEAIELSLAENLQQRTMSPVDEFLAFRALMQRGDTSPGELAKRFGFSERVVKQRLRLAELAPEILDALAGRDITIDSAMAYAATQDRKLQSEIFKVEKKKGWEPHRVSNIKHAISMKGISTDNPLFLFVGEESYERRGGTYEDDLFNDRKKDVRSLANPGLLQEAVGELIEFQMLRRLEEFRQRKDLSPTIVDYVVASDQRVKSWGNVAPKPPSGFVLVEKYDSAPMWRTIRNNKINVHVLVGIDDKGELQIWPRMVFVPKAQRDAIAPPQAQQQIQNETPEQRAAREREAGVAKWARRLAVGSFAGTPFEGRAFWPSWGGARRDSRAGVSGWLVEVNMFVSDEEIAAQKEPAEIEYDRELAAKQAADKAEAEKEAAEKARYEQLLALTPPAVVVVDGEAWFRDDEGSYIPEDPLSDGGAVNWVTLVEAHRWSIDDINATFATREEHAAALSAAAAPEDPDDPGVNDVEVEAKGAGA